MTHITIGEVIERWIQKRPKGENTSHGEGKRCEGFCRLIRIDSEGDAELHRISTEVVVRAVRASLDVAGQVFDPEAKRQVRFVPDIEAPIVTDGYVLVCCRGTMRLIQNYAAKRKPGGFTHNAIMPIYSQYP